MTRTTWIQPGIYAWDGERLKWCLGTGSVILEGLSPEVVDRLWPKKFGTSAEGPLQYQTFRILERREKPPDAPARRPEVSGAQALSSQAYREAVAARLKAIEAARLLDEQERRLKFADETDRLLGTWRVVSNEIDGNQEENPYTLEYWSFSRQRVVYWHADAPNLGGVGGGMLAVDDKASKPDEPVPAPPEAVNVGKFVLDDKAQPKRLDTVWGEGDERSVHPGIYRWYDLRLVWCRECVDGPASQELDVDAWSEQPADKRRPTDFKTAATGPAAQRQLLVLRRVMEPIKVPDVKELK